MNWTDEINNLETFFKTVDLSRQNLSIQAGETITNVSKFVDSHLQSLRNNNGKRMFISHLNRLRKLKAYYER